MNTKLLKKYNTVLWVVVIWIPFVLTTESCGKLNLGMTQDATTVTEDNTDKLLDEQKSPEDNNCIGDTLQLVSISEFEEEVNKLVNLAYYDIQKISDLVKNGTIKLNIKDPGNNTILHYCTKVYHPRHKILCNNILGLVSNKLLNEMLNLRDDNGYTPFYYIFYEHRFADILLKISNFQLDFKSKNIQGKTLLFYAFDFPFPLNYDMLSILLRSPGIDVNQQDDEGNTVLHYCIANNKEDSFRSLSSMLKEQKIDLDVNIKNNQGSTPLDLAYLVNKGFFIKKLISHGAKKSCDL